MALNAASEKKLAGVKPDLVKVVRRAAEISTQPFQVISGARTQAEQNSLYALGRTKPGKIVTWTRNSKHIGGNAIDFAALKDGTINWTDSLYPPIARAFQAAAKELGIPIEWGGTWKTKDLGHIQLAGAMARPSSQGEQNAGSIPAARSTLRKGMTGGDVPVLQLRLRELGHYSGLVDGSFGPKTEAALKAFQTKAKLKVDGVAGPLTWAALGGSPASNPTPSGRPEPIVSLSVPVHGLFTSEAGKAHIKGFETCSLTAYELGGIWHIGWGRSNSSGKEPRITKGLTITQAQADAMFEDDLKDFEAAVKRLVTVLVTQGQFDALVSIAFNKGPTWLQKSEILSAANTGDWDMVAALILKEVPASDHKFYKGLLRRRNAEVALLQS